MHFKGQASNELQDMNLERLWYDHERNVFLSFSIFTVDPLGGGDDNEEGDLSASKPKVETVEERKPEVKLILI